MTYLIHLLNIIGIYIILALSLNLVVGYTGLVSLSHAAFYGIGAYISALLLVNFAAPFPLAMLIAIMGTVSLSFLLAIPALWLRGNYFVLASLSFQVIVFAVLYNWVELTHGPFGISGIPVTSIFTVEFATPRSYLILNASVTIACAALIGVIGRAPFGRTLKAIRENEVAAATLGKNVPRFKCTAFAVAAGFAAVAGTLFVGYLRYVDPTSFTLTESVFILSILIIGGAGNVKGPLAGTVLMLLLPEVLRLAGIPERFAPNLRQVIYGLLIIVIMRLRPQGLLGEYGYHQQ